MLPRIVGAITRFNASGKSTPDKSKPKEIAYRQICWTRNEWVGNGNTREVTDTKEVEYKRYKRNFTPPPSIELKIAKNAQGEKLIISPIINLDINNRSQIIHCINLFLEIFGACEIINEKMSSIIKCKTIKLNWELLPKGCCPWKKLEPIVASRLKFKGNKSGNEVVIKERLSIINNKKPDFVAVGRAGFHGYLIFGFESKNIYILESTQCNNATYILNKDWKSISQLTKANILDEKFHIDRIVHRNTWGDNIKKYPP